MSRLKNVTIKGFRSIKDITLELRPLNVLIGANGAGKSNLIAFFKLVNELMAERLQQYIATGRATLICTLARKLRKLGKYIEENGTDIYRMRLFTRR